MYAADLNVLTICFAIFWLIIFFVVLGPCLVKVSLYQDDMQVHRSDPQCQCSVVREALLTDVASAL